MCNSTTMARLAAVAATLWIVVAAWADPPRRVAVLGDGTSMGQGQLAKLDSWPMQLARMLGRDWIVANFSRGSLSLNPSSQRFAIGMPEWSSLREFAPDVVFVSLGASDAVDSSFKAGPQLAAGLDQILDGLAALPSKPAVHLCLPPLAAKDWRRAAHYDPSVAAISTAMREAAARHGTTVVDTQAPLAGLDEHLVTGFLPDTEASRVLAGVAFKQLTGKDAAPDAGPYRPWTTFSGPMTDYVRNGTVVRALGGERWQARDGGLERIAGAVTPLLGPIDTGIGDFRMRATIKVGASEGSAPRMAIDQNWLWLETAKGTVAADGSIFGGRALILKKAGALKRDEWMEVEIRRHGIDLEFVADGEVLALALAPRYQFTLFSLDPNGAPLIVRDWSVQVEATSDGSGAASQPKQP